MASNRIGIDVVLGLNDAELKKGLQQIPREIKRAGLEHFIKLKLDASDFRSQAQKEIKAALAAAQKAGAMQYRNGKGNLISVNPFSGKSMADAIVQFEKLSSTAANKADAAKFQRAADSLKMLRGQIFLLGQDYKTLNAIMKDNLGMAVRMNKAQNTAQVTAQRVKATKAALAEERALSKIQRLESQIAKERTRNVRSNGQLQSSIYKQIELYHELEKAARKAHDANKASYARRMITDLHRQADALERVNALFGRQGGLMTGLRSLAWRYFSIFTVARLGEKIAETTGYFQQQQVALEGILSSASKARSVLNEIKAFALQSPFQTKELVTFTKQLAAFGVKDNELFPTVKKLADISAGLGVDMGRIILAYGQVKAAAVLRGQELRQFTEAGIPMVDALAKKFSELNGTLVATSDVFKLISERKVPFEMVASVLSDMTAEGGKFYKMQENITNTTYGQIQKLKDLWTLAMDDMGKSAGGFINAIIKGLQTIVKNIEPIAAMLASTVIGRALGNMVSLTYRLGKALRSTAAAARVLGTSLTTAIGGGVGLVLGALVAAIWNTQRKATETSRKMREVADGFSKDTQRMVDGIDSLTNKINVASVGTKKYADAVSALSANYGDFISKDKLDALRDSGGAAEEAARGFDILAESIKEAIKQQNQYLSLVAQGEVAANQSSENSGQSFVRSILGIRHDVLSSWEGRGRLGIFGWRMPDEISSYINDKGLTRTAFAEAVSSVLQQAIKDAAKEGIDIDGLTDFYTTALTNAYRDMPEETARRISKNAFYITDLDSYVSSLGSYKTANATTYAAIEAPFTRAAQRIAKGNYDREESLVIDDKISAEQETANIWREALSESLENAKITGYASSELKKTIADADKTAHDIHEAMRLLNNNEQLTATERGLLSKISKLFFENVNERSGHPERIFGLFSESGSAAYQWRKDKDLKGIVATYGSPTNDTYDKLRKQLQSDISTIKKDIEEMPDDMFHKADRNVLTKQLNALRVLSGDLYYGIDEKQTKSGGGRGGGWRRMFSDLFNYIKEAREEEKKLVEGTAGLTGELRNQINSDQLAETAVRAFWSEGSPFQRIINKIEEYGIESNVFNNDFLKNALESITTKSLNESGIIDYKDVWNQLLKIISDRADKLNKTTGDALKNYLQQMTVEGEKYFGRQAVEDLLRTQLGEMKRINANVEAIRNSNSMFENIAGNSNYLLAQRAIYGGGPYSRYDRVGVTANQLRTSLGASYGLGFASTGPGTALKRILDSGSLNIYNLAELASIRSQMAAMTASDFGEGEDAVKRFDEFKAVLSNFDGLIKQLSEDISGEFSELMKLNDGVTSSANKFTNASRKYVDAIDAINNAIKNGTLDPERDSARINRMRIKAAQDAYEEIAGSLSEGIKRIFRNDNGTTGISDKGMRFLDVFGNETVQQRFNRHTAERLRKQQEEEKKRYESELADLQSRRDAGKITDAQFSESSQSLFNGFQSNMQNMADAASDAMAEFSGGWETAEMIVKYIYQAIKAATQLIRAFSDVVKATDSRLRLSRTGNGTYVDRNGNLAISQGYFDQRDYFERQEKALEMIDTFNQHSMDGFEKLKSGDYIGTAIEIITSWTDLIKQIAGYQDTERRQQQEANDREVKNLSNVIAELNHILQGEAGVERWQNIAEQISKMQEQRRLWEENLALENQMKNADADKAQDIADSITQSRREEEDLIRGIQEEIFNTADSVATQLTDALVEAFRKGENAARAWRDAVRSYIGDVLKDVLLQKVVAPRIDELLDSYGINTADPDSILALFSDPTKAVGLRNALFAEGTWLEDVFNNLPKPIQEMIAWNSDTSALSGGIQGITEDTARTLEGLSNSMLAQLVLINRSSSNMEGIAEVQVNRLQDILVQQRAIRQAAESINSILGNSRDGVRPLVVQVQ